MLKVGLTGGIGSGKTIVSKVFQILGIPVFNADTEAKSIINNDLDVVEVLKKQFGNDIYLNNLIDRKKLAEIIFNDSEALQKVNSIIHPKVREYFISWCKKQKSPYVIEEAAILFESGANKEMDLTINVHADEFIRIGRVMERDRISEQLVRERMNNQWSDEQRFKLADYTIYNDGEKMVLPQVLKIHNQIINSKK